MCQWILEEREYAEQVTLVLVIRERRPKMTWAVLVPRKGTEFPWISKEAAKLNAQLGHNRVTLRCDNEAAIEPQEGSQTVLERPPAGESQSNGIIEQWDFWPARPEH